MADRFPDIGRIDMIQSAFSRPTNQLYNEERNDNAPQQKQQRQTTPPTNPFAPSSSQTPSNSFAPPQQQQQHLPGYPLLPTTTGYQTSSLSPMSAMTPNQPMAAGYQQPMSTGYQQPMAAAWQNQNQLSTNQPAMSMGHSGSPSPIPSMQQPMYTGWSQPQLTSMPQPLVPQETYHQQQPQQQPQQQQLPQQQQQQQLPWGAPQQQMGGGFGGGALGGQGFGGQLGYQQTGMLNAPSQAHAQMAAMTGSGYSAFDPYNPTAGNQSQGRPVSQTSASYAPPIAAASGMGSRTSLFARGEAEEWIRNCLASRRADLGPPVQPPTTFAESYRIVLDQAYENILHAIAQVSRTA